MDDLSDSASNEQRFAAIYLAHHAKVEAFVRRRMGASGSREVVAETFLAAWVNIARLPEDCLPWLYRAARYEVATSLRSRAREQRLIEKVAPRAEEDLLPDPAAASHERDALLDAFAALDEDEREILRLVAWEGVSSSEGARVLGCTVTSSRPAPPHAAAPSPRRCGRPGRGSPNGTTI